MRQICNTRTTHASASPTLIDTNETDLGGRSEQQDLRAWRDTRGERRGGLGIARVRPRLLQRNSLQRKVLCLSAEEPLPPASANKDRRPAASAPAQSQRRFCVRSAGCEWTPSDWGRVRGLCGGGRVMHARGRGKRRQIVREGWRGGGRIGKGKAEEDGD
eukprot:3693974-Rhodomonas_salina.1